MSRYDCWFVVLLFFPSSIHQQVHILPVTLFAVIIYMADLADSRDLICSVMVEPI